jgi:alkaline phosphatase
MRKSVLVAFFVVLGAASQLFALNIYPLDKAQILAGAKFDFKVELDGVRSDAAVKVTVNWQNYAAVLGKSASLVEEKDEAGKSASALILRDVSLRTAGDYVVRVTDGATTKQGTWTVYSAANQPVVKNVIFLLADGLSIGHRTAARLLSKGNVEGTAEGPLAMDQMDHMGLMGTSSVDAITVDSANSMSAYMTGHKSSINAMGVYADRTPSPFDDPKVETIAELVRRTTKKSIGIISDAELEDATPAAVVAHTRRRDEKAEIVKSFLSVKPEVLLGGGSAYFLPKSTPGSKRNDNTNYVDEFRKAGYALVTTNSELTALSGSAAPDRLLGLFHPGNMDGSLDRLFLGKGTVPKYPDQPDLTTMTSVALDILSRNQEGFFLMVEAALVDKFTHPMDWERAVYDTIMFDKVIAMAQEFMKTHPDTLLVVTGDHTHSISVYGTVNDDKPGTSIRDKVGTYAAAGFPNYEDADGDGYPDTPDVSKRLAVGYGNHPDYWETFKPKMDNPFNPTIQNEKKQYVANDQYKSDDAVFIQGKPGLYGGPGGPLRGRSDSLHERPRERKGQGLSREYGPVPLYSGSPWSEAINGAGLTHLRTAA